MWDLLRRLKRGFHDGAVAGFFLCVFASLMRLANGPGYGAATGFSFIGILVAYMTGGLVCGGLAGLLWPLGRSLFGRIVVATLVAWPAMFIFGWPLRPEEGWNGVMDAFLLSLFVGPVGGLTLWVVFPGGTQPRDE